MLRRRVAGSILGVASAVAVVACLGWFYAPDIVLFNFPLDLRAQLIPTLLLKVALLSAVVAATLDAWVRPGPAERSCWPVHRGAAGWLARVFTCDLAYVVVYVTAGMIVWPFVRPFYEHRAMPAMGTILSMQVLRGLVFVALLAWLAHELRGARRVTILLGGARTVGLRGVRTTRAEPLHVGFRTLGSSLRSGHVELPVRSLRDVDADDERAGRASGSAG